MLESDLVKHQCFQRVERNRMLRFWLHRHFENLFEIVERGFGLTISVDYVSQFLKRPKNEERIDKEREELSHSNALGVDEIKHQEQDRSPQKIDDATLDKAKAAKVADFFEFQLEKVRYLRSLSFVQGSIVNLLRTSILFLMLYLIYTQRITVGQFFSLFIYSFFIFGPLQELGNVVNAYRETEASLDNFEQILKMPVQPKPER